MEEIKFKYYIDLGNEINKVVFTLDEIEKRVFTHRKDLEIAREKYSEIKDKNDVEIYNGDIVSMWYAPRATCKGVVEYSNGSFYFLTKEASPNKELLGSLTSYGNYIEVIGNIHENPELLND